MKLLKNKKILIGVSSIFVIAIFAITLSLTLFKSNDSEFYISDSVNKENDQVGGFLTLMLETEAGSGQYQESTASTWPGDGYVFNSELSSCQNGSELSWNEELGAVTLSATIADSCYVYFDVYSPPTLANYIKNTVYQEDGVNDLYYHDGQGSYTNADQEAGDNSYRYSGADPNNYVCFGSDVVPCPLDNLYRIIGVFENEVKLIKYNGIGDYVWNSENNNTWDEYTKPDIFTTLNSTYYNTLESKWQNTIADSKWKVDGFDYNYIGNAKTTYYYEIEDVQNGYVEIMKIGLMYVSDYGYSATPDNWMTNLNSTNMPNSWIYVAPGDWTISRDASTLDKVFFINVFMVMVEVQTRDVASTASVVPSFYLKPEVTYVSGDGSQDNPIRIDCLTCTSD